MTSTDPNWPLTAVRGGQIPEVGRSSSQANLAGGHAPPWHGMAGGDAAHRNNAALWGIQSQEWHGSGYSRLLFDDTDGQLRLQLATTQAMTQLNLVHQSTSPPVHQADSYGGSFRGDASLLFEKPSVGAAPQPLRLSPSQGQKLLDLSRPDQLLADVLEDDPALATVGKEGQRHAWMAEAWRFLEDHRWRTHSIRLAVGHVVLRTSGAALNDAGFLRTVESAADRGDPEMIYSWSPAPTELERIDG